MSNDEASLQRQISDGPSAEMMIDIDQPQDEFSAEYSDILREQYIISNSTLVDFRAQTESILRGWGVTHPLQAKAAADLIRAFVHEINRSCQDFHRDSRLFPAGLMEFLAEVSGDVLRQLIGTIPTQLRMATLEQKRSMIEAKRTIRDIENRDNKNNDVN